MCLIVFSWQMIAEYPLILAANRDEFYDRASAPATWWKDHPTIFAPRDLQMGGTWLGMAKQAQGYKFAAVTNVRDSSPILDNAPSRGQLVSNYLVGADNVQGYVQHLANNTQHYNGFNLLIGEVTGATQELVWFSNRNKSDQRNGQLLAPGIYGLSNGVFNSCWPKVNKAKAEMASLLCQNAPPEAYLEMLSDTQPAPDCRLPHTGVSVELERLLSSIYITSEKYGTRSSSLVHLSHQGDFQYQERILK